MKCNPRGEVAEKAACRFLEHQGWKIITRNWHCPYGEIDIIARDGKSLVFVEVKYRTGKYFGGAINAITAHKAAKMERSILAYLAQNPYDGLIRADAVLLQEGEEIQHLKNILES